LIHDPAVSISGRILPSSTTFRQTYVVLDCAGDRHKRPGELSREREVTYHPRSDWVKHSIGWIGRWDPPAYAGGTDFITRIEHLSRLIDVNLAFLDHRNFQVEDYQVRTL